MANQSNPVDTQDVGGNQVVKLSESTKGLNEYFYDWYSSEFGFGYGTGDEYYCRDLMGFFMGLNLKDISDDIYQYDYQTMQDRLGNASAWYMINALCRSDCIEYGTSPRFGWLTERGKLMLKVIGQFNHDTLYPFLAHAPIDYIECYKDYCNHTKLADRGCTSNPFWYDTALIDLQPSGPETTLRPSKAYFTTPTKAHTSKGGLG